MVTELHCDGQLRDGKPCNKLLARAEDFTGHIETKCPKCSKVMHFTIPRVQTFALTAKVV